MSDYTPPWCDECHRYLRSRSFSDGTLIGHGPECSRYEYRRTGGDDE